MLQPSLFLVLTRFLSNALQDLAQEYRIDPEIIFELYRPVLSQVEPPTAPALAGALGTGGAAGADGAGAGAGQQAGPEEGELPDAPKEDPDAEPENGSAGEAEANGSSSSFSLCLGRQGRAVLHGVHSVRLWRLGGCCSCSCGCGFGRK
jgi:hypothetical protein